MSPLQISGVQGAGPSPVSSPPGSRVNPATPPGSPSTLNSSDNDETIFFDNQIYKKTFFQTF